MLITSRWALADTKLWDPEKHPRDRRGRFTRKPRAGDGAPALPKIPDDVQLIMRAHPRTQRAWARKFDDQQMFTLFHEVSTREPLDEDLIGLLGDEFDQRDERERQEREERAQRVDAMVLRGIDYLDAYAEVHGQDVDELRRQEAAAVADIDRRAGETRRDAIRRSYREHVGLQVIAAEQATRGHLLNPAARSAGIDPVTLFSGPAARARKWASEDLLRWWENNPRMTLAEFTARLAGGAQARAARQAAATAGNGRDFGV